MVIATAPRKYDEQVEREAVRIGKARALAGRKDDLHEAICRGTPARMHAFGACGEILAALEMGIPISELDCGGGRDGGVDLVLPDGRTAQVRTRDLRHAPHGDLIERYARGVLSTDVAVLVWILPERGYRVVGWATQADFIRCRRGPLRRKADGMPLYFMPHRMMREMATLSS